MTWVLAKYVVDIRLRSPALYAPQTTITFPTTSAEEYERLLVEQIDAFRKRNTACRRLVVFVDDLDRLSATEMVTGLDAIRTFLELSMNVEPDDFGVVFVISCDEDRVADALSRNRGRAGSELPGTVFTRSDARRYLDRLFQFRVEIPPFPKLDMRQFAADKINAAGNIATDLQRSGVAVQDVVERLIHVGVQSPRNAIQIVNAFTQSWWLAARRERDGVGSISPGGLHAGAVTGHPLSLAALCVLRVDFPDFYSALQKRPELIRDFNRVLFRGESSQSMAPAANHALTEFINWKEEGHGEIKPEHRALRLYLSSLISLRWPKSLQPLILLAQDATSRRYGDGAAALSDAFVSGDIAGVLEVFGHHLDNEPLGRDQVDLLREFAEGLGDENLIRRVNASRVLAGLAHRLPDDQRNGLMTPLARQMAKLEEVRQNIGPAGARAVVLGISAEDRRDVADRFAADLLSPSELDWKLQTGETPNLDELAGVVKEAVKLILEVREGDGLLPRTDSLLREWLFTRQVRVKAGSQNLPFADLEQWVEVDAPGLVKLLSSEYAALAISEMQSASPSITDLIRVLETVTSIHERLEAEGQESRVRMWEQLTDMVGLKQQEVVHAALDSAAIYAKGASPEQSRKFLSALAARLKLELDDEEAWALDGETGATRLLDLASRWEQALDTVTTTAFLPLLQGWAHYDETAQLMVRGAEILRGRDPSAWQALISYLCKETVSELGMGANQYLAKNALALSEADKVLWVSQLEVTINKKKLEPDELEKYRAITAEIPHVAWQAPSMQTHAGNLFNRLISMTNQPQFVVALFPIARRLVGFVPANTSADFIDRIFEQAYSIPTSYVSLHTEMTGHWWKPEAGTVAYNATNLVQRSMQFIRENPTAPGVGVILASGIELVDKGVVDESLRATGASLVPQIWKSEPGATLGVLQSVATVITPSDVALMFATEQPSDPGKAARAAEMISNVSDEQRRIDITKAVLELPPAELEGEPDGALALWVIGMRGAAATVFSTLFKEHTLNDDQSFRLLTRVLVAKGDLGLPFFVSTLAEIVDSQRLPKTASFTFSRLGDVMNLAANQSDRNSLIEVLMQIMPAASIQNLAVIANGIREMKGSGAIERNTAMLESLDDDQFETIARSFPESRVLKRIAANRVADG